ncbi:ATP-binding protein [Nitrospira sp. Nam80]
MFGKRDERAGQFKWRALIPDAALADAILDRAVHHAHKIPKARSTRRLHRSAWTRRGVVSA